MIPGNPMRRTGCAPYPKDCKTECVSIAADGCVICQCSSHNAYTGSSSSSGKFSIIRLMSIFVLYFNT